VAHYVAPDGRRVSLPIPAGHQPAGLISRYGLTYMLTLVATPTGEDADTIVDRAILHAVREAEQAGELDALLDEEAA
jgi:hypothetical protein